MPESLPRRKKIRLDRSIYDGPNAFSVTAVTHNRTPYFRRASVVSSCVDALTEAFTSQPMTPLAYCFMPDHLHLLLEAPEGSNLIEFMKRFKQLSAFRFKRESGMTLWQKGYYDHIMRGDEDLEKTARYLFENPVRGGLVDRFHDYPFSGGAWLNKLKAQ